MSNNILFAFIDESGQPYQLDEGPYVLAAATVAPYNLVRVEGNIRSYLTRWSHRLGRDIPEIHAREIIQGESPPPRTLQQNPRRINWRRVDPRIRQEVIDRFSELIASQPILLNIVVVEKRPGVRIHSQYGVRTRALTYLIERVLMSGRTPRILLLSIDSAALRQDTQLQIEVLNALSRVRVKHQARVFISFEDSENSPIIQIADVVAYIIRNVRMHRYTIGRINIENAFLNIERRIRRCPGTNRYERCGLKVWTITQ